VRVGQACEGQGLQVEAPLPQPISTALVCCTPHPHLIMGMGLELPGSITVSGLGTTGVGLGEGLRLRRRGRGLGLGETCWAVCSRQQTLSVGGCVTQSGSAKGNLSHSTTPNSPRVRAAAVQGWVQATAREQD
jgi:hypothetical protein